ncbi:hypothetical protein ACA910_014030 [Epithemia clementina (nom. ined.)]
MPTDQLLAKETSYVNGLLLHHCQQHPPMDPSEDTLLPFPVDQDVEEAFCILMAWALQQHKATATATNMPPPSNNEDPIDNKENDKGATKQSQQHSSAMSAKRKCFSFSKRLMYASSVLWLNSMFNNNFKYRFPGTQSFWKVKIVACPLHKKNGGRYQVQWNVTLTGIPGNWLVHSFTPSNE